MANTDVKVITKKQAKKEIGVFGRALAFYLLLFLGFQIVTPYIYPYLPSVLKQYSVTTIELVLNILLTIFVTAVLFRNVNYELNLNIKDYLKKPRIDFFQMLSITSIGIGIYFIATGVTSIFYFINPNNEIVNTFLGNFRTQEAILDNILYFCLYVIIKPICDEYIFRGIIQRQLGHYGRYFGVLGSAFLYAIVQPNLMHAIPSFFVGWYMALVTLRYHSIRPGFVIHVYLHLFIWLLEIIPGNYLWVVSILIVLVYIIVAFSFFSRRVNTNLVRYGATEWKLWKILLTTPSIVLCILLFIANIIYSYL